MDSAKAAKEAEIPQAMSELANTISGLEICVHDLGKRINPVLRPEPTPEKEKKPAGGGYSSPLAMQIAHGIDVLKEIRETIIDYLQTCEL